VRAVVPKGERKRFTEMREVWCQKERGKDSQRRGRCKEGQGDRRRETERERERERDREREREREREERTYDSEREGRTRRERNEGKKCQSRVCFEDAVVPMLLEGRNDDKRARITRGMQPHLTNERGLEGRVAVEGKALGLILAG
jgi:hypothetical protein